MSYDAPTPADLKARFPAFTAVSDPVLQGALTEAARRVDTTWTEGDFATAQMLYAAHVLAMDGHATGAEADAIAQGAGLYKSLKAGGSAVEFVDGQGVAGTLAGTSYGRRFLALQRLNVGGPVVAAPAATYGLTGTCSPYLDGSECRLPGW